MKNMKNILNTSAYLHNKYINKASKYIKQVEMLKIEQNKNFSSCPCFISQNAYQQNS